MSESVPLSSVRPSQLYLSAEKLAAVLDRVGPGDLQYDPLPVFEFDGDLHLTDGHTRAFVAYLTGAEELAIEYDDDLVENYDLDLYRECIEWCEEAGVARVSDFAGRLLGPKDFEERWLDRCDRAAERLAEE